MRKYKDYLLDKTKEEQEAKIVPEYTDNEDVNKLRQLVEDMTKWMSIGNNRANVPNKTIAEFKDTMKKANYVKVQNMAHRKREEDESN